MPMERRSRQNLNLVTDAQTTHSSGTLEYTQNQTQEWLKNRWARISLRAQDKKAVFDNLLTHVNVNSLGEAFKALDGSKELGVDTYKLKQILKSPVREIRMRGSVRGLPFNFIGR